MRMRRGYPPGSLHSLGGAPYADAHGCAPRVDIKLHLLNTILMYITHSITLPYSQPLFLECSRRCPACKNAVYAFLFGVSVDFC